MFDLIHFVLYFWRLVRFHFSEGLFFSLLLSFQHLSKLFEGHGCRRHGRRSVFEVSQVLSIEHLLGLLFNAVLLFLEVCVQMTREQVLFRNLVSGPSFSTVLILHL